MNELIMKPKEEQIAPELNVELDNEVAQGIYSNLVIISHSSSEFIVDFLSMMPGFAKPQVKSRIVLTPEHAKRLLMSLQDNVAKYENTFGLIKIPHAEGSPMFPMGSSGVGEA